MSAYDAYNVFKAKAAFLGGFCLVRITDDYMHVATGEVCNDAGDLSFGLVFSKFLR